MDMNRLQEMENTHLPNIHLSTTSSILSCSHAVRLVLRVGSPIDNISFTINELDVMRTLCITVPRAVLGSRVIVPNALAAIRLHFSEIHGSVHPTVKLRNVNLKGKLAVFQVEHGVVFVVFHDVESRSDVGSVLKLYVD